MIDRNVYQGFTNELMKLAVPFPRGRPRGVLAPLARGIKNFGRDQWAQFGELGSRLRNPIRGSALGWQLSSPAGIRAAVKSDKTPAIVRKRFAEDVRAWKKDPSKRHLLRPTGQKVTGLRSGAEELSRRGWTGQGRVTKYLPVGDKGLIGGGLALEAPSAVQAYRQGTDDSGRSLREIAGGAAAEAVTSPLLGGLGVIPGIVGGGLSFEAGSRLFR